MVTDHLTKGIVLEGHYILKNQSLVSVLGVCSFEVAASETSR